MAVKADNLNKLVDKNHPYIHSNINNFHAIHNQSLLRSKNGDRLGKTIAALETVKNNLQKQTDAFLGGLTPKQFLKEYYFGGGKEGKKRYLYYEAFIMYFRSPSFYRSLLSVAGYNIDNILKEISEDSEAFGNLSAERAAEEILRLLFEKSRKSSKGKWDLKRIEKAFDNLEKDTLEALKQFFDKHSKEAYTVLLKNLKNFIKTNMKSSNLIFEKTKELLRTEGKDFIRNYVSSKKQWDEKAYQDYLKMFTHYLGKALNDLEISGSQHLSGAIGEQFEVSILKTMSGQSFGLSITGNWNETQARDVLVKRMEKVPVTDEEGKELKGSHANSKEAQKGGNEAWKDMSKQSYSDFTLINPKNGISVRVQSKYYQGVVEKFEKGKQNINQHINLFEAAASESIIDFINRLQSTGQVFEDVDPNAIAYVIAISLWFANAGSLDRKNKTTEVTMDNRAIFQEIGSGIGNFLGIVIDEQLMPIMEFSNHFFLINNEVLLPTWTIIEELIKVIKYNGFDSKSTTFSVNKGETINVNKLTQEFEQSLDRSGKHLAGDSNAEVFKEAKRKSLKYSGGVFYDNGGYIDPGLLSVGTAMGKKIISQSNVQMRNINLNINYERAIKSAYNLF